VEIATSYRAKVNSKQPELEQDFPMLNRRALLSTSLSGAAAVLFAPSVTAAPEGASFYATPDDPFPITPIGRGLIPDKYMRQIVPYANNLNPGAIVVDTKNRFLYVKLDAGRAMRFGVSVGKEGFGWSGHAKIMRKVMWPKWTPPREMIARDKKLAKYANGMPGGPDNPLGARAMYLYKDGKDTLYRIHGTTKPTSIGKAQSSGCIRMLNEDVVDVFNAATIGTDVYVLSNKRGG
jgi:lipoprotein-anchoring transpeptidase ErfK/SrfK